MVSIIYNQNGNDPIEIGEAYDPNNIATGGLSSGDEYVVRVVNTSTINCLKMTLMHLHLLQQVMQ